MLFEIVSENGQVFSRGLVDSVVCAEMLRQLKWEAQRGGRICRRRWLEDLVSTARDKVGEV